MIKELTLFELPEDYKFVYKIKGCENKFDFDINTIVEKILSTRAKKVDEEIIKQLKNIGEEKGINELILIDESKVLKMIKSLKALEIIKEHLLDIDWFLQFVKQDISYQHYVYCVEQSNNAFAKRFLLNKEEYELLKEILK